MMSNQYKICTKTVMDNVGDPDIVFDESGICNYYHEFKSKLAVRIQPLEIASKQLEDLVAKLKANGKGKQYDCLIGVSGGVDSTYVAYLVKKLGLRPLAVHMDNGWDSELAVQNIENILSKLSIDLHTEVLDWNEFKDLQLSFLKASTPDGEIPSDHAIVTVMYTIAAKYGIKYIISGSNFRNEGMLPPSWARGYLDWKYIRSVQRLFGSQKLKTFPHLPFYKFIYYNTFKGIKNVSILNYIDFNKSEAIEVIQKELGWKYYGGKHYESIYTRFYQAYILPKKFNIDKRKAHLTCLMISTGEVSRDDALEILKQPIADPQLMEDDKEYLIKKLEISKDEFERIMNLPPKTILDYPNHHQFEMRIRKLINKLRSMKILPN